jgi:hypothetical protein
MREQPYVARDSSVDKSRWNRLSIELQTCQTRQRVQPIRHPQWRNRARLPNESLVDVGMQPRDHLLSGRPSAFKQAGRGRLKKSGVVNTRLVHGELIYKRINTLVKKTNNKTSLVLQ